MNKCIARTSKLDNDVVIETLNDDERYE